jgi:aldehyde:ferredoxin oxidoreductase
LEKTIHLATGLTTSITELREIAAKIATLTKTFNLREGFRSEDDHLPLRLHREALPTGHTLSVDEMNLMLKEYYQHRGWDAQGIPEGYKS